MSSFREEKEREEKLMKALNLIITAILGVGILAVWLDHRQSVGDKFSFGVMYFLVLIFYLLIP